MRFSGATQDLAADFGALLNVAFTIFLIVGFVLCVSASVSAIRSAPQRWTATGHPLWLRLTVAFSPLLLCACPLAPLLALYYFVRVRPAVSVTARVGAGAAQSAGRPSAGLRPTWRHLGTGQKVKAVLSAVGTVAVTIGTMAMPDSPNGVPWWGDALVLPIFLPAVFLAFYLVFSLVQILGPSVFSDNRRRSGAHGRVNNGDPNAARQRKDALDQKNQPRQPWDPRDG
jgi:hypothetical protein